MKHKFKRGDLVTIKCEYDNFQTIELGVILSFREINPRSMYAIIHIIAQLGSNPEGWFPHKKNGVFPIAISNLAYATTDAIDNYFKRRKAHTFSV